MLLKWLGTSKMASKDLAELIHAVSDTAGHHTAFLLTAAVFVHEHVLCSVVNGAVLNPAECAVCLGMAAFVSACDIFVHACSS